jgi:hypothetical protein
VGVEQQGGARADGDRARQVRAPSALLVPPWFMALHTTVPPATTTSPVNVLLGLLNHSEPAPVFTNPASPAISAERVALVSAAKTGAPVSVSGPPASV